MAVTKIKPEKKHVPCTTCTDGNHTYIVTTWLVGGGKEKAVAMRCRNCLMPLDLTEIESAEWAKKNVDKS